MRLYVPRAADVIHVGCGNRRARARDCGHLPRCAADSGARPDSPWVADMVADRHTGRIVNVDISPVVMEHMREKHSALPPSVSWEVGDVTRLTAHADASFDAAIDKGTMDALMVRRGARQSPFAACSRGAHAQCGGDSTGNTAAMAREMLRVLRPGGVFIMVRCGTAGRLRTRD